MIRLGRVAVLAGLVLAIPWGPARAQEPADGQEQRLRLLEQLSGERITLTVEEIEISSLLKLLSQAARVNIVAGPEVTGQVSVNLFDVPFKEALDSILGVGGFTHYRKGDIIFVTTEAAKATLPLGVSDITLHTYRIRYAEPEEILSAVKEFLSPAGKAIVSQGKNLVVQDAPNYVALIDQLVNKLDVPPELVKVYEISHAAPEDVLNAIIPFLSARGNAIMSPGKKLVVQDTPDYLGTIEGIIKELDLPPRQVLISSRILSVTHSDDKSLGVEMGSVFESPRGDQTTTFTQGFVQELTNGILTEGLTGYFAIIARDHENILISALQDKADVQVLAAPQLLVLDGETARIQVGERLGFRITTTTETASLESVEFLEVGTLLEVTPSIGVDGLIKMKVHPEVSSGSISSDGLPSERTTEATTTMIVKDGETIVIGGLLDTTKERFRTQVPVLGSIPILGFLFGRNRWVDRTSELVILITPRIAGPTAISQMEPQINWVEAVQRRLAGDETAASEAPKPKPKKGTTDRRLLRRGVRKSL